MTRLLFLAGWLLPTVALIGGGLPVAKIVAAFCAAVLSGALVCTLPTRAFRAGRLLTALVFPLSWLWIGYVTLNGMGPTPFAAIGTLANTNLGEATTAVRLIANPMSISLGLLQLLLLWGSYACDRPRPIAYSALPLAIVLMAVMANAWIPRVLAEAPASLPGRDDLQNFPYGAMADMLSAWISGERGILGGLSGTTKRRRPVEPQITQTIDAIFVLGETFRFARPTGFEYEPAIWSALNARFHSGLGVMLPKVCASADSTHLSVPMLISGTSPEHHDDVTTAPSGLARLAAGGYETAWISNQEGLEFYSDEPRDLVWVAQGYSRQYDEALLPIAAAFLEKRHGKNKAVLLHLFDSHAAYEDRYPETAEPAGLGREAVEALRYKRANDHTLSVLVKIAAMLDSLDRPAFAIYVSDHGENLLSDHNGLHYHFGARTSAKAAYVPALVFWNQAFRDRYHPAELLAPLVSAPSLAHLDVYDVWMNFAGLPVALSVSADPKILGKIQLTDTVAPVSCANLTP